MVAPLLKIAEIGNGSSTLCQSLAEAGHQYTPNVSWAEAAHFDAIVLNFDEPADVYDAVDRLEEVVGQRQIVIHTVPGLGVSPLLDLRSLGIAMTLISPGQACAITTADEVSAVIAELLVSEMGLSMFVISEEERPQLAVVLDEIRQSMAHQSAARRAATGEAMSRLVEKSISHANAV